MINEIESFEMQGHTFGKENPCHEYTMADYHSDSPIIIAKSWSQD